MGSNKHVTPGAAPHTFSRNGKGARGKREGGRGKGEGGPRAFSLFEPKNHYGVSYLLRMSQVLDKNVFGWVKEGALPSPGVKEINEIKER